MFNIQLSKVLFSKLALLSLSIGLNTWASDYYISKSGDDLNTCEKEQPCLTIQKGLSLLNPGDTLNISQGVYSDIGSSSPYYNQGVAKSASSPKPITDWLLVLERSGTKEKPITIQADPENEGEVILDGGHIYNGTQSFVGGIMLRHQDYIHFKNFTIRNVATHGIYNWNSGVKTSDNSKYQSVGINIQGLTIHHVGGGDSDSAIAMNSSKNWKVINNHIYDIYGKPSNNPSKGATGISSYGTIDSLIEYNLIENVKNGVLIKDHYNISNQDILETEIRFNMIKALNNGIYISGKSYRQVNENYIHHNIITTSKALANGIKYMLTNTTNSELSLQNIQNNLIYGNNSNSSNGIYLTRGSKVNIKGNIILDYKKGIFSAYTAKNPVNIDYSDYNIFASIENMALLDAYNKGSSFITYHSLSNWKDAKANESFSLNIDNPDSNSINSNENTLFKEYDNYTYKEDSPAIGFMPDGSNAGPYQNGDEVIGLNTLSVEENNIYYVAKSGSDLNNCTKKEPCLTIQKGLSLLNPGDTLNIKEGIYTDIGSSSEFFNGVNTKTTTTPSISNWLVALDRSGTKEKPITIQADPQNEGEVILDGQYLDYNSTNGVGGIMIRLNNYIHFKNFTIRNVKAAGIHNWDRGENYRDEEEEHKISYGVKIEGLKIHHVADVDNLAGIRMDSSKNWIIRNNHIYDIYRSKEYLKVDPLKHSKGAGIQSYGTINALIENNLIEGVSTGIFFKDHYVKNADTREPVFESEVRFNRINATLYGLQIGVQPDNEASKNYFHNNIVTTNKAAAKAIFFNMASKDLEFTTTALQRIENNILHGNSSNASVAIRLSGTSNVQIKGNIILGYKDGIVSQYLDTHESGITYSDYNIFGSLSTLALLDQYPSSIPIVRYPTLSSWQEALASQSITLKVDNPDTHSIISSSQVLFKNEDNYNYKDNSPAIGLMPDNSNAGAYQNGDEIIGLE